MKRYTSQHFPALRLVMNGREKYRVVKTVRDAAEALLSDWPCHDGEQYMIAVQACLDAFYDVVPAEVVGDALIRAANEDRVPHISLVS
jgi:hypothetical protein